MENYFFKPQDIYIYIKDKRAKLQSPRTQGHN